MTQRSGACASVAFGTMPLTADGVPPVRIVRGLEIGVGRRYVGRRTAKMSGDRRRDRCFPPRRVLRPGCARRRGAAGVVLVLRHDMGVATLAPV